MKKYINSNKSLVILLSLISAIVLAASSVEVFFGYSFIESISSSNASDFWNKVIILSIATFVLVVASFLKKWIFNKLSRKFSIELNNDILKTISKTPSFEVEKNKEGKYLVWLKERVQEIKMVIFELGFNSIFSLISSVIYISILFFLSWKLSLIGLAITLISFIAPLFLSVLAGKINQKYMNNQEDFSSSLMSVFNGFRVLYYLAKKETLNTLTVKVIERWIKDLDTTKSKVILLEVINSSFNIFADLLYFFLIGYFIFFLKEPIAIIFVFPNIFVSLTNEIRYIMYFVQYYSSFKNLINTFSKAPDLESKTQGNSFIIDKIELKNISLNYEQKEIIKDFSFVFEKGKKYAIVGKSGSGKSSLISILLKQQNDYQGDVLINDINLKEIDNQTLNNSLSYLNNEAKLLNESIYNNVALWEQNKQEKVEKALELAMLNTQQFPLEMQIDQDSNLSSGQKQRLNIARHFFRSKNLLVLDEALSNIDKENCDQILKNIFSDKELILINVTHHLNDSHNYDYVINFDKEVNNE
ncbi:ATP-binding cassette domain-containing protein [Mycoplasma procyoni]|uniref:ATP-binding cassette domain-containing protein n=1 Tax=Mycoplasma procyoni TaxID=568784 RepID=UPI00197C6809|nr:ABC transporter ATP-binding protein [Mycoplasma procyoni]MBN3534465.1 ABC transporter ATP-binding protein [Mycoplasma procyoni]